MNTIASNWLQATHTVPKQQNDFTLHMREKRARHTLCQGFSLIEIMIVVAIIGIISAIALPSYSDYVVRGKIPEATSQLATKQILLEQYFQDNRTYVGSPGCAVDTSTSKYFNFTCTTATLSAESFNLIATGKDSMTGFSFTVDQSGSKTTASVPDGWTKPSPNNCWVTKKGGIC